MVEISKPIIWAVSRDDGSMESSHNDVAAWWSLTKTLLAVACLRLSERDRLDLDADFDGMPFTLRQLLRHVAGVPNYTDLTEYHEAIARGAEPWSDEEMLERVAARSLRFEPGRMWGYSNTGYYLLRRKIEQICDQPINHALSELVLDPVGLSGTRVAMEPADLVGCHWMEGTNYDPRWVYHGLAIGPATEAVRFLDAIFREQLLSERSLSELIRRSELGGAIEGRPWTTTAYGAGLMAGEMKHVGQVFGHSGVGQQSVSACYHMPEHPNRLTVCVFAPGCDEADAEWEVQRIARL